MAEPLRASPLAFIRSFGADYFDYMSAGPSVPAAALALYISNPWAQVALWATAALCLVLTAYRMWRREREKVIELTDRTAPKFNVSFNQEWGGMVEAKDKATVFHSMSAQGTAITRDIETRTRYFRIWVDATTEAVVHGCIAYIVALEKKRENEEVFIHIPVPQPLPLNGEAFDVMPKIRRAVDFLRSGEDGSFGPSPGVYWPHVFDGALSEHATYRFTFAVHGGGVTAPQIRVEVRWQGQWDAIAASQVE